jgi:hypothetical protein
MMRNAIQRGILVFVALVLTGLCLALSGCDELALKTLVSIRTQGGLCVSVDTGSDDNLGTPDAPMKTIDAAIEYLQSNDFSADVLVAEGDYHYDYSAGNPLTVVEGISLYGGYSTDFSTRDPEAYVTRIIDNSSSGGFSETWRAIDVPEGVTRSTAIDGFTIEGGSGRHCTGIYCSRSSPTISNNRIDGGTGYDLETSHQTYGIYCYYSGAEPKIINNREIYGGDADSTYGIFNSDGADPLIEGNYIHGGTGGQTFGIWNSTGCEPTISGNNIHGGIASGSLSFGIRNRDTVSGSSPKIWNNTIFGGEGANFTYGIGCYNIGTALIYNNTIDGGVGSTGAYGIYMSYEIPHSYASTPDIRNNIIYTSSTLATSGYCVFEGNPSSIHAAAVRYNDFWDANPGGPTYILYRDSEGETYDSSEMNLLNGKSWADGNVSLNPGFADRDGADDNLSDIVDNDWHLTSDSHSTIRTGGESRSGYFTTDKDGNDRTGGWSMGAYEIDSY